MTARRQREFLRRELVQHKRFRELAEGDPIMESQFDSRVKEVEAEIALLPEVGREAKTTLYFDGGPVAGSRGLDADVAIKVLAPFLEMVKTQYAAEKGEAVGARGVRRHEAESRLLLTGTPRGSFGLELSAPESDDLFAEDRLADVLLGIGALVDAATKSDEDYLSHLDSVHERAAAKLQEFYNVLAQAKAGIRIETGDHIVSLDRSMVSDGLARVSGSTSTTDVVEVRGTFRGAVLEKWQYNFLADSGDVLSGRIGDEVSEEQVVGWLAVVNQFAAGKFRRIRNATAGGASRSRHILVGLAPLNASSGP